jgi:hypothetical protein
MWMESRAVKYLGAAGGNVINPLSIACQSAGELVGLFRIEDAR